MKNLLHFAFLLVLLGCDSFPTASYSLGSFSQYSTEGQIDSLCGLLQEIAVRNALERRERDRPETQCYFSESESNSIVLGARKLNEQLVVDVQAFNRNEEFRAINAQVEQMLNQEYSGRFLHVSE